MKIVGVREAKAQLSACIDAAQDERVIITVHGRPVAIVYGLRGMDLEDVVTASDPEFWRMIERRRARGRAVPAADVRRRLGHEESPPKKRRKT